MPTHPEHGNNREASAELIRRFNLRSYLKNSSPNALRSFGMQFAEDLAEVEPEKALALLNSIAEQVSSQDNYRPIQNRLIIWQEFSLDLNTNVARIHNEEAHLRKTARRIMQLLISAEGATVPASAFLQGRSEYIVSSADALRFQVHTIRNAFPLESPAHILTERSTGYRLVSCLPKTPQ